MGANISLAFHLERIDQSGHPFALDFRADFPSTGITVLYGASGSGKTTLLRAIAGLERVEKGRIKVGNNVWQSDELFIPTHKRSLGYVFQESSLFNHLRIKANLDYAYKRSYRADPQFYAQIIELLGIESLLNRFPAQISGGERQRVAIARSLLARPKFLLMDEPLASLDEARKQEILPYFERIHTEFEFPILYVTHSINELMRLADHVLVIDQGRLLKQGDPVKVFSQGEIPEQGEEAGVLLQGKVVAHDQQWHLALMQLTGGELWVRDTGCAQGESMRVRVQARDVSLSLSPHSDSSILNRLAVEVVNIQASRDPAVAQVQVKAGEDYLLARITRKSVDQLGLKVGMSIWAQIKSAAVIR